MEGAWKPWRIQHINNTSPDLDSYGKPLPSPPPGYYWEQQHNKSWELKKYIDNNDIHSNMVQFNANSIIEHVVMPDDTIQGICLRYRVSPVTLRQYNNFSGNSFKYKKYLRIPIEPGVPIKAQLDDEPTLIQRFKNETNESTEEAKFYLSENDWDFFKALASWSGDESWESTQAIPSQPSAPPCIVNPKAIVTPNSGYVPPPVIPMEIAYDEQGNQYSDDVEREPLMRCF